MKPNFLTPISALLLIALTACAPHQETTIQEAVQTPDNKELIAHWPFEDLSKSTVSIYNERRKRDIERELLTTTEAVNDYKDIVYGHSKQQQGVTGQALKFDQYSSEIIRKSGENPNINPESFTIEAWIAPQSYPWNWCPIVMHRDENSGYYFGVDGDGRFGMHVSIDGKWYECNSKMPFPGLRTEHQWNSDRRAWEYKGEGNVPQPEPFGENRGKPVVSLLKWSHLVGTFDSEKGIKIYLN
ncbi:MAG: LamG-like jellyroll fold domain-containing protein, partial [Planctomycetota bacterium]